MIYAFPLTIRPLGYTAWAVADSVDKAADLYQQAVNRGLSRVRIIDADGIDITDSVIHEDV